MQANSDNREIVRTIILLAKNSKLKVIAESIETIEQDNYLKSLNCHFGQGYFYSKPVDAHSAGDLIINNATVGRTMTENADLNIDLIQ